MKEGQSAPREFWIGLYDDGKQQITIVAPRDFSDDPCYESVEPIHVIEYSAFEAVTKELEQLKIAFGALQSGFEIDKLEKELAEAKAQLAGNRKLYLDLAELHEAARAEIDSLKHTIRLLNPIITDEDFAKILDEGLKNGE